MTDRKPDPPLVEIAGSVLAAKPDEMPAVLAELENQFVVMSRRDFNSMMATVAMHQAEYKKENSTLRQLLNLPDLDAVDQAEHFATESDL
ncbi:hypothetical protein L3Y21_gp050 [Gordonia phage Rabbitrun]|uniref:Uncharacterized protein n=1 Tax=Gordonia phage Rabbitrun TaxID=2762280 RepID=A0A7G8LIM1_9CAUD|nr:hypothetical protein L3Y21_gp050 [Gordonia phage Rabbitrun]QNJ57093.1 hypothetical protein SEA_RABBITRUN_50 [Gordonia phage Rabbitrun]